tara:strand:+ start:1188 stop:2204 length:1017 start_codon:yes stop_codon:yes gene_type:complete
MKDYIFGVRNNTHILDLRQSVPLLHRALEAIREVTASGGRVLLVGTKRQAAEKIADTAQKTGQYFVNHRWLGGMLTNWKTISISIKRLKDLDERLAGETQGLTKKELLNLTRERDKLERALGGIREMGGLPDILFIIDTNKEQLAIQEANKLGIPIVAILDSNSDPEGVQFPVPGNDDAMRAISLYCDLVGNAVFTGLEAEMVASGADLGEAEIAPVELGIEEIAETVVDESGKEESKQSVVNEVNASESSNEASSPELVSSEDDAKEPDQQSETQSAMASDEVSHEEVGEKKSTTDRETLEPGKVEEKKPAKKTAKKTGSTAKKTTPKKKVAKEEEK